MARVRIPQGERALHMARVGIPQGERALHMARVLGLCCTHAQALCGEPKLDFAEGGVHATQRLRMLREGGADGLDVT